MDKLTMDDVNTLIGHALVLRGGGQTEMPEYLFGLATRIALALGDEAAAKRVSEVCAKALEK